MLRTNSSGLGGLSPNSATRGKRRCARTISARRSQSGKRHWAACGPIPVEFFEPVGQFASIPAAGRQNEAGLFVDEPGGDVKERIGGASSGRLLGQTPLDRCPSP